MKIPDLKYYIEEYDEDGKDYVDFDSISKTIKNNISLNKKELLNIAKWKLRNSWYPTHKSQIEQNTGIKKTTRKAFAETDDKSKIKELIKLKGVGVPVASAILTMKNPKDFAIIDVNVWYAIYRKERRHFSPNNFVEYMEKVRNIRKEQNLKSCRDVDKGLFVLGKRKRKKRLEELKRAGFSGVFKSKVN